MDELHRRSLRGLTPELRYMRNQTILFVFAM